MGPGGKRGMLLVLFATIVLLVTSAASQTIEKGEISGTVLDQTGAAIPDASVKIVHVATGGERTLTTGANGSFAANLLSVGGYRIEVSAKGFATTVVKAVHLAVGQNLIQDVTLKLAAVGHTIEVIAETDVIDKAETRENTVIDRTYVEQLPINGRDFREFVNLSPTADTTPGLRSPVRLGGQLGEYTELIIDGVDNRNSFFGEWFGSLETKNFTLPEDAVQEFQVRAGDEQRLQAGEVLNWQAGNLPPFDPIPRVAWRDKERDIVLFEVTKDEADNIGPCIISEPPAWPPPVPKPGQLVLVGGYPKLSKVITRRGAGTELDWRGTLLCHLQGDACRSGKVQMRD